MKHLTEKKKQLLRDFMDNKCEECGKKDLKLEPHRIRPGDEGGKYEIRNIKMCCKNCHEIFSSAQRIARGIQK
jgi:5-methylcytosine-specific restriction endonuclease McrA